MESRIEFSLDTSKPLPFALTLRLAENQAMEEIKDAARVKIAMEVDRIIVTLLVLAFITDVWQLAI